MRSKVLAGFRSEAAHIAAPLTFVRAHGGVEMYLKQAGLSGSVIEDLRRRLLE